MKIVIVSLALLLCVSCHSESCNDSTCAPDENDTDTGIENEYCGDLDSDACSSDSNCHLIYGIELTKNSEGKYVAQESAKVWFCEPFESCEQYEYLVKGPNSTCWYFPTTCHPILHEWSEFLGDGKCPTEYVYQP